MLRKRRFRRIVAAVIAIALLGAILGCGSVIPKPEEQAGLHTITKEQRQTMEHMNEIAEMAYQSSPKGNLEDIREKVAQLSALSTKLSYDGLVTVEGMHAVAETITGAMTVLNGVSPEPDQVIVSVAKIRLAMDALKNREQPMWLGFRETLTQDLQSMSDAVKAENEAGISRSLGQWKGHTALIRPAIVVSRSESEAVKLDSITAFLESSVRSANWGDLLQALPNVTTAMEDVFREEGGDQETVAPMIPTAEPPHPVIWSLFLGSFIVMVLSYVAWRRYRADQGIFRVKRERDIHEGP